MKKLRLEEEFFLLVEILTFSCQTE